MDSDLEPFVSALRRQRIALWVSGLICAGVGVVLYLFAHDRTMSEDANQMLKIGVGGGFVLLGIVIAVVGSRSPEKYASLRTLVTRAADVVWIFPTIHKRNGIHVGTSYTLGLLDGKKVKLMVHPHDAAAGEASVRGRCPRAKFGYDPDWEQLFKTNPAALRS